MTDLETYRPPTRPAGRPVPRFVAAWLALALLFGALWWSGLVAPRLSLGSTSGGSYDIETGRATLDLTLHNSSPFAVEVRHATPAKGPVTVDLVQIDGVDVATRGQKVAGGGEARMLIELTCRPFAADDRIPRASPPWNSVKLEVTVRTAIGLERTRATDTIDLPTTCFG